MEYEHVVFWLLFANLHFHFARFLVVTKRAVELLIQWILPSLRSWLSFRSSSAHFTTRFRSFTQRNKNPKRLTHALASSATMACYTQIVHCVSSRVVSSDQTGRNCLPNMQLSYVYHGVSNLWFVFAYRVGDDHLKSAVFCLDCSQPLFTHTKEKANKASARGAGVRSWVCESSSFPYLKTPKKDETGQMDNRNQAKWVCFLYFIHTRNILFRCPFVPFVQF